MLSQTKVLFIVGVLFALAPAAHGQTGNIKGRVLRKNDNKPLFNATVRIKDSQKSTRTDTEGTYSFDQLAADKDYVVEVTKEPLYEDGQTTVNVKSNTTANAADVSLVKLPANANAKTLESLQALLDRQDIDELETKLGILNLRCKGEGDDFCKNIEGLSKEVEKKKLALAKERLDKMQASLFRDP